MPLELKLRVSQKIAELDPRQWDACANPESPGTIRGRSNPFVSHRFLAALEASKSVGAHSGWHPAHVIVEDSAGTMLAAAPTYFKSHSMGEYIFDHAWADAYQRAGGQYYPKLLVAVPFTPASGPRLLLRHASPQDQAVARAALIRGLRNLAQQNSASSLHINFPTESEWQFLQQAGFLQRTGQQFHFINKGYADFDAFLADLASRKRKMIRRERQEALAPGIEIHTLNGAQITNEHWDAFFEFYMDTGSRKWGRPYLTRAFFDEIGRTMAQDILLILARRQGRWIAGAINFLGDDAVYGRNWGEIEHHPFLHFEVCYYQAIEYAIKHRLARVEAGAQGEHKLARGYGPVTTYSAHEFEDPRMMHAIGDYLARERMHVDAEIEMYSEHTPFRRLKINC